MSDSPHIPESSPSWIFSRFDSFDNGIGLLFGLQFHDKYLIRLPLSPLETRALLHHNHLHLTDNCAGTFYDRLLSYQNYPVLLPPPAPSLQRGITLTFSKKQYRNVQNQYSDQYHLRNKIASSPFFLSLLWIFLIIDLPPPPYLQATADRSQKSYVPHPAHNILLLQSLYYQ